MYINCRESPTQRFFPLTHGYIRLTLDSMTLGSSHSRQYCGPDYVGLIHVLMYLRRPLDPLGEAILSKRKPGRSVLVVLRLALAASGAHRCYRMLWFAAILYWNATFLPLLVGAHSLRS
jgi:hypothetical protein